MSMVRGHSSLGRFSPMVFKRQKFFPLRKEQNPPNPSQQDSPVPFMPHKKTPQQPTPGPSGTQWLEDLFCKPSQHNEPAIPGRSQPSKPHEDALTCGPEPEVALKQSMEGPFGYYFSFFIVFLFPNFSHPSFDHLQLVWLPPPP
ncbi:hypothetical protein O181_083973 [Austropuccinia psidii MF-1]|uniref:Uncharacterized protein n=1 Tax=Austropuccinia psidii MF-1 TaxID=1389203 RepID=A0A9Q3FUQ2_9BASI|nr:hypothetical protein [Austropuccinia psidii MF-1]